MQPEERLNCMPHLKYKLTRPTLTAGTVPSQKPGVKDTRRRFGSQFLLAIKPGIASVISTVNDMPLPPVGPAGSLCFARPKVPKLPTRNSGWFSGISPCGTFKYTRNGGAALVHQKFSI